jgi:hypothetical protein
VLLQTLAVQANGIGEDAQVVSQAFRDDLEMPASLCGRTGKVLLSGHRPLDAIEPAIDLREPAVDLREPTIDLREPTIDLREPTIDAQEP